MIAKCFAILTLTLFLGQNTVWALEIPRGLSAEDRDTVVRMLGSSSATKALSNPYPLGGYSGFEIGYSMEFVNVRNLQLLGTSGGLYANKSSDWQFSRISVGKGLYNDVDIFFSLMLPTGGVRASDYGGLLRWTFYQAEFLPINLSVILSGNQLNLGDAFVNRNLGGDILAGISVDNFSVFFGGGILKSTGTFVGCPSGSTNSVCTVDTGEGDVNQFSNTVSASVIEPHSVVGVSLHLSDVFVAAQVDRYEDAVYSVKTGLRF